MQTSLPIWSLIYMYITDQVKIDVGYILWCNQWRLCPKESASTDIILRVSNLTYFWRYSKGISLIYIDVIFWKDLCKVKLIIVNSCWLVQNFAVFLSNGLDWSKGVHPATHVPNATTTWIFVVFDVKSINYIME